MGKDEASAQTEATPHVWPRVNVITVLDDWPGSSPDVNVKYVSSFYKMQHIMFKPLSPTAQKEIGKTMKFGMEIHHGHHGGLLRVIMVI